MKKQKCCYLSCLWSQVQRDTPDPGNSQTLGRLLTKHNHVKLNRDSNCFLPVDSKECINSASVEKYVARRGAQLVSIGIPTICWKTFPAKTTKKLSTRNSGILIILKRDSCLYGYNNYWKSVEFTIWKMCSFRVRALVSDTLPSIVLL